MKIGVVGKNSSLTEAQFQKWKTELTAEAEVFNLQLHFTKTANEDGKGTFAVEATASATPQVAPPAIAAAKDEQIPKGKGSPAAAPPAKTSTPKTVSTIAGLTTPPNNITAAQLKAVFPNADDAYLQQVADELNIDLASYGLDTALRRAHFFAQVRQEVGAGLQATEENLNYSPEVLVANFSYYRKHKDEADVDGYALDPATKRITRRAQQEKIANKVYANRIGNGDTASGDGWRFRGRGLIQLTGRANYASVSEQYKLLYPTSTMNLEASPERVKDFPFSVRSAVAYWIMKGLHVMADRGAADDDVNRITAVINKNTNSYEDRRTNFKLSLRAFQS
jgi:putative chitinase